MYMYILTRILTYELTNTHNVGDAQHTRICTRNMYTHDDAQFARVHSRYITYSVIVQSSFYTKVEHQGHKDRWWMHENLQQSEVHRVDSCNDRVVWYNRRWRSLSFPNESNGSPRGERSNKARRKEFHDRHGASCVRKKSGNARNRNIPISGYCVFIHITSTGSI